ncbi:hypothetical protein JCM3765_004743 [Sporobolomyces pararoseus]
MAPPTVDELLLTLTHLPPDVNPFLWLQEYLQGFFIPQYTHSARIQLYSIVALHAVCVLILLASLGLRYRNGQFWLFRWQSGLIIPNLATVPAVAAIPEVALFEVLLIGVIKMMNGNIPDSYGYSILLVGVLPAIVGEFVTWSIAAGFILHCHKTLGSTSSIRRWTLICNILGVTIPLLHFGCFLPIDILVGQSYERALESYHTIESYLQTQADEWIPSTPFQLTSLIPMVGPFTSLETIFLRLRKLWKIAYCFHAVVDVLLIFALTTIATLYLNSVGRVIRRARQEVADSGRGGETLLRVQQTWTLLVVVLSMFLLLASFSLCLALYAATHPLETPQSYVFTSFWSSAILTTLCSSLLLLQTWLGGGASDIDDEEVKSAEEEGRTVGFRTSFPNSKEVSQPWWRRLSWTKEKKRDVRRGGGPQGRFGGASISVMVEVFSRVETIEQPEDYAEEVKPRVAEITSRTIG